MNRSYLSLGSNLGDRLETLKKAVRLLNEHEDIQVKSVSSIYETDPIGYTEQPAFLNIAVAISTNLSPEELLQECQRIEESLDRVRTKRWGPRTIDLDILLYNHENIETETLTVPHPRMHERAFVLVPLAELSPEAVSFVVKGEIPDAEKEGVRLWKAFEEVNAFLK